MGDSFPHHHLPQVLPTTDWDPLRIDSVPSHLFMVR